MHAEQSYLFRHALLRDAAYQLQLPGDRARLHALAAQALESVYSEAGNPGALDAVAREIAEHICIARQHDASNSLLERERRFTRLAAEHAESLYRTPDALELWQRLADISSGPDAGESVRRAGAVAAQSGLVDLASRLLERARSMAVAIADATGEGAALVNLAILCHVTGRPDEARNFNTRAIAIAHTCGDLSLEGRALSNLASVDFQCGRMDQAELGYEQARALSLKLDNRKSLAAALSNLAGVYQQTGRRAQAEQSYLQAIEIARQTGHRRLEGVALGNLALLRKDSGLGEKARQGFIQALAIHRETGNRRLEATMLDFLARLHADAAEVPAALARYEEALAIFEDVRARPEQGICACNYALCLAGIGRRESARDSWNRGVALLRGTGQSMELARKVHEMHAVCAKAGVPPLD